MASAPHHPAEVYLTDPAARRPRQLTHFNSVFEGVSAPALGKSEIIRWQTPDQTPKNWQENGILTYPPH